MSENYTLKILGYGGKENSCQVDRISHWDEGRFIYFYYGRCKIMFIILIQDYDYNYVHNSKILFIKKRDGIIFEVSCLRRQWKWE